MRTLLLIDILRFHMGVQAIKKMGGTVIAQDKATCESFGIPEAAIDTGSVDWVVPLNEIAKTLVDLVNATMVRKVTDLNE